MMENFKFEKDEPDYVDVQEDYLNSGNLSDGLGLEVIKEEIKIEFDNNLIQITGNVRIVILTRDLFENKYCIF